MDQHRRTYTRVLSDPISPTAEFGYNVRIGHNVIIGDNCKIGDNCLIDHGTIIRPDVTIADNTEIRPFCFIGDEAVIGSRVKVFQYSDICSLAIVGDGVYIGVGVILTNTRRISHGRGYPPLLEGPIIEDFARVASGSLILPGIVIGRNALVGAGAVVTRNVPEGKKVMGIPARYTEDVSLEELL